MPVDFRHGRGGAQGAEDVEMDDKVMVSMKFADLRFEINIYLLNQYYDFEIHCLSMLFLLSSALSQT